MKKIKNNILYLIYFKYINIFKVNKVKYCSVIKLINLIK
jgi:hypothetical protein